MDLRPHLSVDARGYAAGIGDVLLPLVWPEDFVDDLRAGDGNELQTKFRAAHSSAALAVNAFAPFRSRIGDLTLPGGGTFDHLRFEARCATGLRGGRPPHLDLLVDGTDGVVGVESKLTEHLVRHRAAFSGAYDAQIRDARRKQGWFREMARLSAEPDSYVWLDAAQLIKHAFGLAHTFRDRPSTLLYLFWEPLNPAASPEFAAHRAEIAAFADRVAGSGPRFVALSYPELWAGWAATGPDWVKAHVAALRARYLVAI